LDVKKAIKLLKRGVPITHNDWSKDIFLEMVFATQVYTKNKEKIFHGIVTEEQIINYFNGYSPEQQLEKKWMKWEEPKDPNVKIQSKLNELELQKELIETEIIKYKNKLI
jgi:hypothetical protein